MIKIKLHSLIDIITNSSTEIYTYSQDSIEACKDLINEFFKISNIDKTCDEVFDIKLDFDEDEKNGVDGEYPPETFLNITTKDSKYENLATLICNFLYSTKHEACYDG